MTKHKLSNVRSDRASAVGVSLQGISHDRTDMPMQDNHAIRVLPGGWILAVVADGVGSEPFADIGSETAAETFASFVEKYWGYYRNKESILGLMKTAYIYAVGRITQNAEVEEHDVHAYSTTLHAVVFANGIVYYAHSGDGGIIVMTTEGDIYPITEPQKGEDGESVVPLLAGPESWQFGSIELPVQSVLLCTDGLFDKLAGKILREQKCRLDRALTAFFISPWSFDYNSDLEAIANDIEAAFRTAEPNDFYPRIAKAIAQGSADEDGALAFVAEHIYDKNRPLKTLRDIQDDITVVTVQKTDVFPSVKPVEWYLPPDWDTIYAQIYGILYGAGEEKNDVL